MFLTPAQRIVAIIGEEGRQTFFEELQVSSSAPAANANGA